MMNPPGKPMKDAPRNKYILAQNHRPRDFYVDPNTLFVVVKFSHEEDDCVCFKTIDHKDYFDLFQWWSLPEEG